MDMKMVGLLLCVMVPFLSFSQIDSSFIARIKALDTANVIKSDTIAAPDDAMTKKIRLLLRERSGLTIQSLLQIKIAEEQQKDTTHSKEYYNKLVNDVKTGITGKLLDNCLVNIYRRTFTEDEIDELIRFYNTPAGKKMDKEFLLLLLQSVKDAEQLLKLAAKRIEK